MPPLPRLPRPVEMTPAASGWLDFIRFLAAMAVMLSHWRGLLFVEFNSVAPSLKTLPIKALYFLTNFGHQSVMVFFVLSGLFISSSVLRNINRGSWHWKDYIIDRGVRLYVVMIPGLALGAFWDSVGVRFFNESGIYSAVLSPFGTNVPAHQLNLATLFGNLLFLQTRFTTVFGSNVPLWSLFNEFWYYVLFPVLIAALLAIRRKSLLSMAYVGLAIFSAWILKDALYGFLVWLAGGSAALTARYLQNRGREIALCGGALTGICLFASHTNSGWLGSDLTIGITFAIFVTGIIQSPIPLTVTAIRCAKELAGFSYSLYMLHFPLLLLVRAKWLPASRWQPDGSHLLMGFIIAAGVLLYAFAIAYITERHTSAVRSRLRAWAGPTADNAIDPLHGRDSQTALKHERAKINSTIFD